MEKLLFLQQNCQKICFLEVEVRGGYDDEGDLKRHGQDFWAQLARVLKLGNLGVHTVSATRNDLLGGRRDDLRAIWDALATDAWGYSSFDIEEVPFPVTERTIQQCWNSEEVKEKVWNDFELILDTKAELWPKRLKQVLEFSEEEDSSDDSEDLSDD